MSIACGSAKAWWKHATSVRTCKRALQSDLLDEHEADIITLICFVDCPAAVSPP